MGWYNAIPWAPIDGPHKWHRNHAALEWHYHTHITNNNIYIQAILHFPNQPQSLHHRWQLRLYQGTKPSQALSISPKPYTHAQVLIDIETNQRFSTTFDIMNLNDTRTNDLHTDICMAMRF